MSFVEVSHTADVKIRATAPTLEILFSEALSALMQVLYGPDRKGGRNGRSRLMQKTMNHS